MGVLMLTQSHFFCIPPYCLFWHYSFLTASTENTPSWTGNEVRTRLMSNPKKWIVWTSQEGRTRIWTTSAMQAAMTRGCLVSWKMLPEAGRSTGITLCGMPASDWPCCIWPFWDSTTSLTATSLCRKYQVWTETFLVIFPYSFLIYFGKAWLDGRASPPELLYTHNQVLRILWQFTNW